MTAPLPTNVGVGTVIGRFVTAQVGESGTPVAAPIAGTVTFTPTPVALLDATGSPPVTILPTPITVSLVDGAFSVGLVATDDADLNPVGWNYKVSFKLTGASYPAFNINVPQGTTVDLTTVAPVTSSNGVAIVRGLGVPDTAGATTGQVLTLDASLVPVWRDAADVSADAAVAYEQLARDPDVLMVGALTRNDAGLVTSATVTWPDGTTGSYHADVVNSDWQAIDGYHITYGDPATKTYTQPAVTRDPATGAVTTIPGIVVS